MKHGIILILSLVVLISCSDTKEKPGTLKKLNWSERTLTSLNADSLKSGSTYLSVYSDIYSLSEERTLLLTATVSLKNPNLSDTVYITAADYYNTEGMAIRKYTSQPIYIAPMETIEIVIPRIDEEGGTGANFIFNWKANQNANDPIFEAVMIHAYGGNYGFAFTTVGVPLRSN